MNPLNTPSLIAAANRPGRPHRARPSQRGFSIVELLVAMAIGLALLAALVTIYVNGNRSNLEMERSVRQLDNSRFAMEVISEDIKMAGYYGDVVVEDLSFVAPDPANLTTFATAICSTTDLAWDVGDREAPVAMIGLDATQAAAAACLDNHLAGTPALVIRRVDTTRIPVASIDGSSPYLQTSRCTSDDVNKPFVLSANAADLDLRQLDCSTTTPNTVQRYLVRIYFVASCNECGNDTVPTLKVAELRRNAAGVLGFLVAPLAEGVEDMALEYGFDTDDNGSADIFGLGLNPDGNAATTADNTWGNVVATRVFLLTRTTDATPGYTSTRTFNLGLAGVRGPFNDTFKRRVYTMSSRLNNIAGPRETP